MANTYELISAVTVSSPQASISFSSIPSTYTDLVLRLSTRTVSTGYFWDNIDVKFNGVSNVYNARWIDGNQFGTSSGSGTATAGIGLYSDSNGSTSNTFASIDLYIPNYAGSTQKSVSADQATEQNGTEAFLRMAAALYTQTTSISSIAITSASAANFGQYSTAYLYGVSNA